MTLVNQVARAGHQVPTYVANKRIYSDYELFREFGKGMTWSEFGSVLEQTNGLVSRFNRFKNYLIEVYPQWEFVERINWADNSIERVEFSPVLDKKRIVREVAPHGDICF